MLHDLTNGGECDLNLFMISVIAGTALALIALIIVLIVCRKRRNAELLTDHFRKEEYLTKGLKMENYGLEGPKESFDNTNKDSRVMSREVPIDTVKR